MILWDCLRCSKTRNAPCGPVCIPAEQISTASVRSALRQDTEYQAQFETAPQGAW